KPLRIANPFRTRPQRLPNLRQRILVVEGREDVRRLNSEVLICSGYHVDAVDNGLAAWNTLQINNYDLMITSQNLPTVSGAELLKKMHHAGVCLPVIMTTNALPTWDLAAHPWMHTTNLLHAPYSLKHLITKVKNLLHMGANARQETAPPPNWQPNWQHQNGFAQRSNPVLFG
ncbi:MAG: response regulator, partial [Verrucomicrobiota bacterium]